VGRTPKSRGSAKARAKHRSPAMDWGELPSSGLRCGRGGESGQPLRLTVAEHSDGCDLAEGSVRRRAGADGPRVTPDEVCGGYKRTCRGCRGRHPRPPPVGSHVPEPKVGGPRTTDGERHRARRPHQSTNPGLACDGMRTSCGPFRGVNKSIMYPSTRHVRVGVFYNVQSGPRP